MADKRSRKFSVLLSLFFASIWLFCMGLGTNIWHFFVAEFFNAISLALFSGAFISYLIDNRSKEYSIKEVLGTYDKFSLFGMAIFSFLGAAFIDIDSKSIWLIAGVLILLQLILLSSYLPKDSAYQQKQDKI